MERHTDSNTAGYERVRIELTGKLRSRVGQGALFKDIQLYFSTVLDLIITELEKGGQIHGDEDFRSTQEMLWMTVESLLDHFPHLVNKDSLRLLNLLRSKLRGVILDLRHNMQAA